MLSIGPSAIKWYPTGLRDDPFQSSISPRSSIHEDKEPTDLESMLTIGRRGTKILFKKDIESATKDLEERREDPKARTS